MASRPPVPPPRLTHPSPTFRSLSRQLPDAVASALYALSLDVAGDQVLAREAAETLLDVFDHGGTAWMPTYEDIAHALR